MTRYRTIVADPPWEYAKFNSFSSTRNPTEGKLTDAPRKLPYPTMTVDEIAALPVADLCAEDAHLYLWTTQRYLWVAPSVAEAWGFSVSCVLTWCKTPMGQGLGYAFSPTTEFVLFARKGSLAPLRRHDSTWFAGKRGVHSQKPEVLLDLAESVSPGPRVELFARRNRLGWDTWGNQCFEHTEMGR